MVKRWWKSDAAIGSAASAGVLALAVAAILLGHGCTLTKFNALTGKNLGYWETFGVPLKVVAPVKDQEEKR